MLVCMENGVLVCGVCTMDRLEMWISVERVASGYRKKQGKGV